MTRRPPAATTTVGLADTQTLLPQALALVRQGRSRLARELLGQLLQAEPTHFDGLNLRGVLESMAGRSQAALGDFDRAIAAHPQRPETHANRASALMALGQRDAAAAACEQAMALAPGVDTLSGLAVLLMKIERYPQAQTCCERIVAQRPDDPDALNLLAVILRRQQRSADALAVLNRAVACAPGFAAAHVNRGNVLADLERHDDALASYRAALELQPASADHHASVAEALVRLDRGAEALAAADAALAIDPHHAQAHMTRGAMLHAQGHDDAALAAYDQALPGRPRDAVLHTNRGVALAALQRHAEAEAAYAQALAIDPDHAAAHFNRGLLRLLQGDLARGWPDMEWRWRTPGLGARTAFAGEPWLGQTPLIGKTIVLHAEQGLGDAIQFVRYAARVKAAGAQRVLLQVPRPLTALLTGVAGVDRVLAAGARLPAFDEHCPLMSLPLAFGTRLPTVPADGPYLHADPERVAVWQEKLGERTSPRVGLVWSGNPRHRNDHHRSIPLAGFLQAVQGPARFVALQKDVAAADRARLTRRGITSWAREQRDLADTAALIDALDLVVAVDTSVAHLAGAMGKPVWLLLPWTPDWRWLLHRDDSPWYPSMRLFRQPAAGDWASMLQRVGAELQAL